MKNLLKILFLSALGLVSPGGSTSPKAIMTSSEKPSHRYRFSLLCYLLIGFCYSVAAQERVKVFVALDSRQTEYALGNASRLFDTDALQRVTEIGNADLVVSVNKELPGVNDEGFTLAKAEETWRIVGKDPIGAMYGIFEVAEHLSFGKTLGELAEKTASPSSRHRFIKFNLPWSSYRKGEVIAQHEGMCRNLEYWESFLDMMAVNRLNALSLWNIHPFTDLVKLEKYPEASSLSDAEFAERQKFWSALFGMAKERGVQTYLVNWNIFLPDEFVEAHDIKEYKMTNKHWGEGYTSELIEDYTRECVKQVINEYPDLTGIGLTLGEGMGGMTAPERRDWIDRTFIRGMEMADRKAKLLYRAPLSASTSSLGDTDKRTEVLTREYLEELDTPEEIVISFKYNWSHGHSSDKLFIVHGGKLTDTYWNPAPANYSILWTVRNEDFFVHRWAQPDFVRAFAKNNLSQSHMAGCIIGSECYIPAKDYFSNEAGQKYFDYAFERQWLWYSIWGRLLYDINTDDRLFAQQLNKRFGIEYGEELLDTWKTASDYYHLFSSFYKGSWDAALYSEAFTSMMRGPTVPKNKIDIITMAALGNRPVLDTTRYVNIADYVSSKDSVPEYIRTPPELAEVLRANARKIIASLGRFPSRDSDSELEIELTDIEVLANLQLFFAERIDATLLLAEHLLVGEELAEAQIKAHLDQSISYWETVIELKERFNKSYIPYVFKGNPDLREHLETLKHERDSFQDIEAFWIHRISTLNL